MINSLRQGSCSVGSVFPACMKGLYALFLLCGACSTLSIDPWEGRKEEEGKRKRDREESEREPY